ncbi:pyridoxine 5'-phosphate synthase [Granulosicoccus antarcticus]|uniref:Pyridoxine 5'-phosphate synthase n=1 Tax=Granulosicoccus antarcticus IMCC3135 TaxID=1192854 RepID=A0A2Z2NME9_9GAMM|nr:pyridoxine 5'-phosphate synthase [Granulosicoccus antarcticus]ASJ72373.1 Pyridoxine 5'-phosphate synthase [Granulosicoccus antarcticus IMCC3135]
MKQPIHLCVNVNHVATVRQSRQSTWPDPVHAALQAELAGADGIAMQLRRNRHHIQDHDVERFAQSCQTKLILQVEATDEMREIALRVMPRDVSLVPENREELGTEGGLDIVGNLSFMTEYVGSLQQAGIQTALFINPEEAQIEAAARVGAPVVELHTGRYSMAVSAAERTAELARIVSCCDYAFSLGLTVNAGHGLHYDNVQAIAEIESISELTIGHSLIARALYWGLPTAVSKMKRLMVEARHR